MRGRRGNMVSLVAAALCALSAASAVAQSGRPPTGLMLGSTIEDRLGRRDRDRNRRNDPQPGWTGGVRFFPGYGYSYCDQPVIIVNNSPCYVPGYYTGFSNYGGYGGYTGGFSAGGFSAALQVGGLSLGYRQSNGYFGGSSYYGVPNGGYYRETVREYVDGGVAPYSQDRFNRERSVPYEERAAPTRSPNSGENDYYLHRKPSPMSSNPALAEAVRDIETAFRSGNMATLERHVDKTGKLTLQVGGTKRQEMAAEDYVSMTRDALKVMKTSRYELSKVVPASNGAMLVTGTHVLKTEDGQQKSFTVGFVLKQRGEAWMISEVSAEPDK